MAGSLTRLHGLENEIWLIRNRGFSIFESATMGGPAGHFFLKGKHVKPGDVRTFARQLEQRAKAGLNSPPPIELHRDPPPAADVFKSAPLTISSKEPTVTDIFRGMTEAEIRNDMALLAEEWGTHSAAARAAGVEKSRWNNVRHSQRIATDIMLALYGPEGTSLRAEIRAPLEEDEQPPAEAPAPLPADDAAEAAGDPLPPATVSAEASKAAPEIDEPPAGEAGGAAGSDLGISLSGPQEPLAPPADTPDRLAAVFAMAQAEISRQLELIAGEIEALEEECRTLKLEEIKLRNAGAALADLAK